MLKPYKLADNVIERIPCPDTGIHCYKMTMLKYEEFEDVYWGCPHGGWYVVVYVDWWKKNKEE